MENAQFTEQVQTANPVQNAKPSHFTEQVQNFEPVQNAEPSHFTEQVQNFEQVQTAKPSHFTEQVQTAKPSLFTEQVQNFEPVQNAKPSHSAEQIQNSEQALQTIFARNCEVRKIDKPTASAFLAQHHRYGAAASRYHYGLFVSRAGKHSSSFPIGSLVAVAQFSAPRKWQKNQREYRSYEWVRYASLKQIRICGGMGKMLQHFISQVHPDDVMTYAPAPYDGAVYQKLGFKKEEDKTFPDGHLSHKFRLKLTDVAPPGIEPGSTV